MDSLLAAIEVLFGKQDVDSIIELIGSDFASKNWFIARNGYGQFISAYTLKYDSFSQDQARGAWNILKDKWLLGGSEWLAGKNAFNSGIFNVLIHFSRQVIGESNNEPVCKFEHLLGWHTLTQRLGEDLFTTSYFAHADSVGLDHRTFFSWKEIISHDNQDFNSLYHGRMADIHNHLKGTGFSSELNWLGLMNDIEGRKKSFDSANFALSKDRRTDYTNTHSESSLYVNVIKAAAIRLWLMLECCIPDENCSDSFPYDKLISILGQNHEVGVTSFINELSRKIEVAKLRWGRRFFKGDSSRHVVDYAIMNRGDLIDSNPTNNINCVLSGERYLLYKAFGKIYRQDSGHERLSMLLYIYLLIKNRFFHELLQVNESVGFANFADYESRKEWFIKKDSIYKQLLIQTAVESSLLGDGNKYREVELAHGDRAKYLDDKFVAREENRYLETRIAPDNTVDEMASKVAMYDADAVTLKNSNNPFDTAGSALDPNWDYVVHFIKKKDSPNYEGALQNPRNWNVRTDVKNQSFALYELRQRSPQLARRVVGIDAANSEIFCRPEVFAQAFRYLRSAKGRRWLDADGREREPIPDLGVTYHVGEDYWDIIDGLRSVREALMFLEMRGGDRIGHGLVLGTDIERYYEGRHYAIPMPNQCILDNMAFLLVEASDLDGFEIVRTWAEEQYDKYFRIIHSHIEDSVPPVSTYYQSWLIRGDSPGCYTNENGIVDECTDFASPWERSRFAHGSKQDDARRNKAACKLYHYYHYNAEVKRIGEQFDQLKVPRESIPIFLQLQEKVLREVESRHISIECNPSSNFKIGEMERYIEHPIFKFYNMPSDKHVYPHHLRVSINTDDKGVFPTSLEREFALLAAACDKDFQHSSTDVSPREVRVWLAEIMEMAFEMRFRKGGDSRTMKIEKYL